MKPDEILTGTLGEMNSHPIPECLDPEWTSPSTKVFDTGSFTFDELIDQAAGERGS